MTKKITILFFTLLPLISFTQHESLAKKAEEDDLNYDTNYIDSHRERLTLRTFLTFKSDQVKQQGGNKRELLDYQVNRPFSIGIGFSYKWLNLSATLFTPFPNWDKKSKGVSSHFDLRITTNGRSWVTDFWAQKFGGYYLANTKSVFPFWNKPGIYYQRPDINTTSSGGIVYYNIRHKKFSFKAIFSQTERQLKSKGTPLIAMNWTGFEMNTHGGITGTANASTDSALTPYVIAMNFKPVERITKLQTATLGLGVGYAYTYVYKEHWFFTLMGTVFLNSQSHWYYSAAAPNGINVIKGSANMMWRGAMGYNSHSNYFGLTYVFNNISLGQSFGSTMDYNFSTVNFIYAHRIDVRGKKKRERKAPY